MNLPASIYHLAESANWPSIQRHGLLSTERLLDLAKTPEAHRARLERAQRLQHSKLMDGIEIRDQRPMPACALESCLVGLAPFEWYALINAHVFFWLDPQRLNRQRAACEPRPQVVLTVDAAGLVAAHGAAIALTPINTGNARRRPALRGRATFVPYDTWVDSRWSSEATSLGVPERQRSRLPVELTVADSVPDILRLVVGVDKLDPGEPFRP